MTYEQLAVLETVGTRRGLLDRSLRWQITRVHPSRTAPRLWPGYKKLAAARKPTLIPAQ